MSVDGDRDLQALAEIIKYNCCHPCVSNPVGAAHGAAFINQETYRQFLFFRREPCPCKKCTVLMVQRSCIQAFSKLQVL